MTIFFDYLKTVTFSHVSTTLTSVHTIKTNRAARSNMNAFPLALFVVLAFSGPFSAVLCTSGDHHSGDLILNHRELEVPQEGVSLLFQNDGTWTNFTQHSGALLFYDTLAQAEAASACGAHGEALLKFDVSNKNSSIDGTDDLLKQFSYMEYLGDLDSVSKYWVASSKPANGKLCNAFAPSSAALVQISCDTALPFICSNSAPVTTAVDTNFTSAPRAVVTSSNLTFTGTRDRLTFRFVGIPYAAPPTGKLRFRYPEPYNGPDQIDVVSFKPACLQFGFFEGNAEGLNPWGNSEDCLFLNIFTPYLPPKEKTANVPALKPVLFWIHGGGNTGGTGSDGTFDGGSLVSRSDVVVVTINHRLNIFGFLGLDDGVVNGNYALADKIAALQWVKDHISAFGGDPERVTIFGQSAGGWSVVDLLVSPKARGLFSGAISQSGGSSSIETPEAAAAAITPFLEPFCNGTGTERLVCLQSLDAEVLLNITNFVTTWTTIQDGVYSLGGAVGQAAKGPSSVNSVPFLTGFMPEEGQSLLGTSISPNDTNFSSTLASVVGSTLANDVLQSGLWTISDTFSVYNATIDVFTDQFLTCDGESFVSAASSSKAFPSIHVYEMQRAYALSFYNPYNLCSFPVGHPQLYYRCHSGDLYETFGTYHLFDQPIREVDDVHYTTLVQDMWGAFARTRNPNPEAKYLEARSYNSTAAVMGGQGGFVWPEFTPEAPMLASLNYPSLALGTLPDIERCKVILS